MNRIRVGRINYVNTYPLFYTILKEKHTLPFDIVSDIPTALNRMMREGKRAVSTSKIGNNVVLRFLALSPEVTVENLMETVSYFRGLAKDFDK